MYYRIASHYLIKKPSEEKRTEIFSIFQPASHKQFESFRVMVDFRNVNFYSTKFLTKIKRIEST